MTTTGETQFDVVIIGGGPGGYATALYGAAAGLNIAMVERDKVGGTCLHRGCVPAKEFLETAAVYRTVSGAGEFGIGIGGGRADRRLRRQPGPQGRPWSTSSSGGCRGCCKGRKVTVLSGTGTLLPGRRVRVVDGDDAGTEVVGRHVVLAAGSVPRTLPGLEVDGRLVLTSDEFLDLDADPAVRGGRRGRGDRLRVRLAALRPRLAR